MSGNKQEPEQETIREVHGFQCMFCGEIYEHKEEATLCWSRHVQFQMEPLFNLEDEFPFEVLVKKVEGLTITEIGTYSRVKKEKVNIKITAQEAVGNE